MRRFLVTILALPLLMVYVPSQLIAWKTENWLLELGKWKNG